MILCNLSNLLLWIKYSADLKLFSLIQEFLSHAENSRGIAMNLVKQDVIIKTNMFLYQHKCLLTRVRFFRGNEADLLYKRYSKKQINKQQD